MSFRVKVVGSVVFPKCKFIFVILCNAESGTDCATVITSGEVFKQTDMSPVGP